MCAMSHAPRRHGGPDGVTRSVRPFELRAFVVIHGERSDGESGSLSFHNFIKHKQLHPGVCGRFRANAQCQWLSSTRTCISWPMLTTLTRILSRCVLPALRCNPIRDLSPRCLLLSSSRLDSCPQPSLCLSVFLARHERDSVSTGSQ